MIVFGYRVETLAKCVAKEILDDDVLGLAAELAYYFFFSLFPIMLFITPMLSFFGNEQEIVNGVLQQLGTAIPPDAQEMVADVVRSVVTTNAPGLMSIGALLALWAGSNVFNNLITALNRAYDVEEARPWWKRRLIAMAMVQAAYSNNSASRSASARKSSPTCSTCSSPPSPSSNAATTCASRLCATSLRRWAAN